MVQWTSVYRPIRMSILSGSWDQLPFFPLPTLGIEPGLPVWVESALTTKPCCLPNIVMIVIVMMCGKREPIVDQPRVN